MISCQQRKEHKFVLSLSRTHLLSSAIKNTNHTDCSLYQKPINQPTMPTSLTPETKSVLKLNLGPKGTLIFVACS